MNRAYSLLDIKRVDEQRDFVTIRGMASTPTPDRVGDIVVPEGAKFKTPMPLLWQHQHDKPVGQVTFAKPDSKGIPFEARIPNIKEPGVLKDRVDEAVQSIKHGLVSAVSIGFRAIEDGIEALKGGGYKFNAWEWIELSLVTVPANAEATISTVKAIDRQVRAASGQKAASGVSGKSVSTNQGNAAMYDVNDQVAELEERRAQLVTDMKSYGDVTDLDDEQSKEYDAVAKEFEDVEVKLNRARKMQAAMKSARPVADEPRAQVKRPKADDGVTEPKLEKGISFARVAKVKALARLDSMDVQRVAKSLYGTDSATYRHFTKAAVAAATTTDATWASPLVGDETSAFADFVEFLRPQTILGRLNLRKVPFRTALAGQTSGGAGYWVGEGAAKPLTKFDFSRTSLTPLKVANIAVATMELLRDSSPSAEGVIRDQLAAALRERLDRDFIDPAKAAVADQSPASITNGVVAIVSSGITADNVRTDIKAVFESFIAANNAPTSGVWIMSATTALALSLMYNPLGQPEFPGISMNGGTLFGLPVVVSEYVPAGNVVLANQSDIYLADEGGISVDMSQEATLTMDDAPAGAATVSLWQNNMVGFRAERTINWAKRRPSAVALLSGVNWGG